jgi:hypothetical protein
MSSGFFVSTDRAKDELFNDYKMLKIYTIFFVTTS